MNFTFQNNIHQTTARASSKDYRLTRRQVQRLWLALCGDLDCACGFGGVQGENKCRLKKLSEGAEILWNQ